MRALLLFLLIVLPLFSTEAKWTRLLLEQMINNIDHTGTQKVYTPDAKIRSYLEGLERILLVERCGDADLVVTESAEEERGCTDKPAIVLSYRAFKQRSDAIGAFFWQKGRPTVVYSHTRLKAFGLVVSDELKKYVVKQL